jgi:hypothetical protein
LLGALTGVGVFSSPVTGESSRISGRIHASLIPAGIAILSGCLLCLVSSRLEVAT